MTTYIVGLFQRAAKNEKLTAHERAALKALQGAFVGLIVAILPDIIRVVTTHGTLNWTADAVNALLTAFALGFIKLYLAQTDSHLGDVLDVYSKQLQAQAIGTITGSPTQDASGAVTIPAIHMIIPTVKVVGADSSVLLAPPLDGKVALVAATTTTLRQFIPPPVDKADIPTQPNRVVSPVDGIVSPTDSIMTTNGPAS